MASSAETGIPPAHDPTVAVVSGTFMSVLAARSSTCRSRHRPRPARSIADASLLITSQRSRSRRCCRSVIGSATASGAARCTASSLPCTESAASWARSLRTSPSSLSCASCKARQPPHRALVMTLLAELYDPATGPRAQRVAMRTAPDKRSGRRWRHLHEPLRLAFDLLAGAFIAVLRASARGAICRRRPAAATAGVARRGHAHAGRAVAAQCAHGDSAARPALAMAGADRVGRGASLFAFIWVIRTARHRSYRRRRSRAVVRHQLRGIFASTLAFAAALLAIPLYSASAGGTGCCAGFITLTMRSPWLDRTFSSVLVRRYGSAGRSSSG